MQQAVAKNLHLFKSRSLNMNFDLSRSDYKAIENIGTGAYGVVCSAVNVKTGKKYAIKKIPNAFEEIITAKRTFRELKILRHFDHENVIHIHEILMPREPLSEFKDVYVVMDLMESDLHQILHSNQPFTNEHTQYFLYQILRGLKYIHSANVIHRDLKPSNLLVNENCELKIGDFGMARGVSSKFDAQKKLFMTQYVATRWYRAPELLFSAYNYSQSVDMWSVGCIFAEMLSRKQLFPGKHPMDQLVLIVNVLGMPPESMLQSSNSDQIVSFFHTRFGGKTPVGLASKLKTASPAALSLLSKMLVFEPEKRISIEDALKDPFVLNYHDPDDEPICLPTFDFSFDDQPMTKEQIRQQVGKMILKYTRQKMSSFKLPGGGAMFSKAEQPLSPVSNVTPASSSSLRPANNVLGGEKQISESNEKPSASHAKIPDTKIFEPDKPSFVKPSTPPSIQGPGKKDSLAVSPGQVVTDVEMKSARSACNEAVNNILSIAAKTQTESGGKVDIEMKSAKKDGSEGSLQVPGEAAEDVQMLSAKGDKDKSNIELKEATPSSSDKVRGGGDSSDPKSSLGNLATTDQGSVFKGQMGGPEDTKALIKAALKNTVLMKSKMKKERQEFNTKEVKPSRKMSLALSRQREREEKRRQRQKRAKDKQRKSKGSSSEKENQGLLLTTEDRNLLEKWKVMQSNDSKKLPGKVVSTEDTSSAVICGTSSSINQGGSQQSQVMVSLNTSGQGINTGAQIGHQGVLLTLGSTSVLPNNGQNLIILPVDSVPGSQTSTSAVSSFLSNAGGVSNPPTMQNSQQILTFTTQNVQPVTTVHNPVTTIGPLGPVSSYQDAQPQIKGENVSSSSTLTDISSLLMDSPPLKLSPKTVSEDVFLGSNSNDKPDPPKYGTGYRSDEFQGTPSPPSFLSKSGIENPASHNSSGPSRDAATPPDMNAISDHLARAAVLEDHLPYLQLTPRGDGSGYGLGVNLEDFLYDVSGSENESGDSNKPGGEAQLSASVFSGILREHDINPDDLQALHQELGLTSPITLENISQISPTSETAAGSP
ncbi:Mitogen-activated protein kinase 7 [Holothuria leucospilota]|uniref:Mitogen-activated protein kinase n=1 Tax=Holothuria leucospilota TaxID=206669 RepID=A0A9Q1CF82_HOLLE|nr:Mitogen-activated protein kinase 7 [Holothuria leucospilota]